MNNKNNNNRFKFSQFNIISSSDQLSSDQLSSDQLLSDAQRSSFKIPPRPPPLCRRPSCKGFHLYTTEIDLYHMILKFK